jgi:hypothetical protein
MCPKPGQSTWHANAPSCQSDRVQRGTEGECVMNGRGKGVPKEDIALSARRGRLGSVHALKVQVKNGRLVLDEPTDLPDGAEVEVVVIDDNLTGEERAELHASLERALDDSETGRGMDAGEYLKLYRARRENRSPR